MATPPDPSRNAETDRSVLAPGRRIGLYEVLARIGSGGMGDVYRARDNRLGREVAVKVLPSAFTADPDRLARFEREARVLASLSHPHIATIHGVEESDGVKALVLELVPGDTLAEKIASGPRSGLPIAEALNIARQIADALDAAHEKGIVHRDLKPANIKITPEGQVKVLDFGLAKRQQIGADTDVSQAPTEAVGLTRAGLIVGTAAYMSPEQARGQAVDRRTDIWAFGCIVYEMLTGRSMFGRETFTDTIAAIVDREPDWSALPAGLDPAVARTLKRCLRKELKQRARDIGDVRSDLDDLGAATTTSPAIAAASSAWRWPAVVVGAAAIGAVAVAGLTPRRGAIEPPAPLRLSMSFVARPVSQPFGTRNLAISDDGTLVAYAAREKLWLRRMPEAEAVAIGPGGTDPFFSPAGDTVALFAESGLMTVPVDGGPPRLLVATTDRPAGGTWSEAGAIVFATTEGMYRVATGGAPELLASPKHDRGERLYAWPQFLPGGQAILFTVLSEDSKAPSQIAMLDVSTRRVTPLIAGGSDARYLPTGHLVFAAGAALKVARFEPEGGVVRGEPVSVPAIDVATASDNGASSFALSPGGTLIFRAPDTDARAEATLVWVDRQGARERIAIPPGSYGYTSVSPDGTRVALNVTARGNRDIWLLNLARLSLTQLTDGPTEDILPEWSSDGRRVFFASDRAGNFDIYSQAADGATPPRVEFAAPGIQTPNAPLPDGSGLVVYDRFQDLSVLKFARPDVAEPLLHGKADERLPSLSPDGKWIVYESDESGSVFEIFVRPFPNVADGREKVSTAGGRYPHWSRDGKEVFYISPEGDMIAAAIATSPALRVGTSAKLFSWRKPPPGRSGMVYDISPSDGRFLFAEPAEVRSDGPTAVSVVVNWTSELARIVR